MTLQTLSPQVSYFPLRTQTLPPATTTNAVFVGKEYFLLIDPGTVFEDEQKKIDAELALRLSKGHIFLGILLTHDHLDHCSDAHRISEKFSAPYPLSPNHLSVEIEPIHTPGHHPRHIAYWVPNDEILIAGDMVSAHGTILIEPKEGDLGDYMMSLEKLIHLNPAWVIPAHGPAQKGKKILEKTLKHRRMRLSQISDLLLKDPQLSGKTAVDILYRGRIPAQLLPFAVLSAESSLIYLRAHQSKNP